MSELTYEKEVIGRLENFEWDNVWWERNGDTEYKRIMYIGDSISRGIRIEWNRIKDIEWYIDNCATSKAVDNPYFLKLVALFGKQQINCHAILINNGLHGWHLSTQEYAEYYQKLLLDIKGEFNEIPIIVVTSTSVTDENRNVLVEERNKAAIVLAEELKLPVIDLYEISTTLNHLDGVHFDTEGYQILAETIRKELKNMMNLF